MARIRPFRALRYSPEVAPDLAPLVAPPYDVVDADEQRALLARHPRNVIRLELPPAEPGDDDPDDCYRRAGRILAEWRGDGTLHKDPRPSFYVYEQTYRVPGTDVERTQRGFFARVGLEPFGPEGGILPHERTMSGPKEDRYKLLRATSANTSPVISVYDDPAGLAHEALSEVAAGPADADFRDGEETRHRLWAVPDDGVPEGIAARLSAAVAGPLTIGDGHHRYETALRYREDRSRTHTGEEDPAFDYLLMLLLSTAEPLTVLPTHRLVRDLSEEDAAELLERAAELFDVEPAGPAELRERFGPAALTDPGSATGRIGVWTRAGGAILGIRPAAIEPYLPDGGAALRALDVTVLGAALDRLLGIGRAAVTGGRLAYTKSVDDGLARVDSAEGGIGAAFFLAPPPVAAIEAVAADGDVMPQKSTYFYPKALTGLVINPHEW